MDRHHDPLAMAGFCEDVMTNRLRRRKQTFATLIFIALLVQMVSFGVFGQSLKNGATKENQQSQTNEARRAKIAPDLEEQTDKLARGMRGDEWQKVLNGLLK